MYHISLIISIFSLLVPALCYIPGVPSNKSNENSQAGDSATSHRLLVNWFSNGSVGYNVSLLAGRKTSLEEGAMVSFSEEVVTEDTPSTLTPWIGLLSCDSNTTNTSTNAFLVAQSKGAVALVLYSLNAETCTLNDEYLSSANATTIMDIYSITNSSDALQLINDLGRPPYFIYNSTQLNISHSDIIDTIKVHQADPIAYTLGILTSSGPNDNSHAVDGKGSSSGKNTALAMIVLYSITGCVSGLFCVVIISGAIRAFRHPERYGPRRQNSDDFTADPESHARGLTRAILDTFPIVKFGSSKESFPNNEVKDIELAETSTSSSQPSDCEQKASPVAEAAITTDTQSEIVELPTRRPRKNETLRISTEPRASGSADGTPIYPPNTAQEAADIVPSAIGRETCPICILDFEDDDDIRILPCEGHHRFHQQCVDPWLLELSSSCPLCRHDFAALENMLSRENLDDDIPRLRDDGTPHTPSSPRGGRFSRYIRMAIHRRRERDDDSDPTDPEMPQVADTSIHS